MVFLWPLLAAALQETFGATGGSREATVTVLDFLILAGRTYWTKVLVEFVMASILQVSLATVYKTKFQLNETILVQHWN